jgi:purine-binding chemotaxis protein CheW
VTPDEIAAVLAARARALAVRPPEPAAGGRQELLAFTVAGARYALPTAQVAAVVRLGPVTRVPRAPAAVAGVTNHGGAVLLVADLPALLGLGAPAPAQDDPRYLLVVHDGQAEPLGLVADELHDVSLVAAAVLHATAGGGAGARLTRALTGDGCLVLDGARLLSDPALTTG